MNTSIIFLIWLAALTLAQLLQWSSAVRFRRQLLPFMRELDVKSELQRLQSSINEGILSRNADVVHRARELLARIKEDKDLHDKVWTQVQSLENTLK